MVIRNSAILMLIFFGTHFCLSPLFCRTEEAFFHQEATSPPSDFSNGEGVEEAEGDAIDKEIERYFTSNKEELKFDDKRLEKIFPSSSGESRFVFDDKRDDDAERFANVSNNGKGIPLISHKVVAKDTLYGIGRKYGISPEQIVKNNPDLSHRPLYIGEEIMIVTRESRSVRPNTRYYYHTVKPRENLTSVAKRYSVSIAQLAGANRINKSSHLQVGQKLLIPGRSVTSLPAGYRYEGVFVWPLKGPITSGFGYRRDPFFGYSRHFHKGVDIGMPMGTPFHAARDGLVIFSGRMGGYGNVIFIRHAGGYVSVYGHAQLNYVKKGDAVKRGERIGLVGRTGAATGPHLHFEIRQRQVPINPIAALQLKEIVPVKQTTASRVP